MKLKINFAACMLAAAAFCGSTASAGQVSYVNLDEGMVFDLAKNVVSQEDGGSVALNMYAGDTLESYGADEFAINAPVYSFYKSHILTKTPSSFAAGDNHLITVYELKFKAELQDETVDYRPKINYGLRYSVGTSAGFVENQQESSHLEADGEWITLRYELNPVTQKIRFYKNGELEREISESKLAQDDITEFRFYPRTIPEKNGDGLYPNDSKTLNFGDDDGKVKCCTPVIWTYDYVKIYQITPFEIADSEPAEGAENVDINGPFRVRFDMPMNVFSLNPSTVQMELMYDGLTIPAMANDIGENTFEITPFGQLEYFSRYRLKFSQEITDENGLNGGKERYVGFTTEKRSINEDITAKEVSISIDNHTVKALKDGVLGGEYKLDAKAETEVKISAALYRDNDGAVECVTRAESTVQLASGENTLEIPELTVSGSADGYVKVMVWRTDGYPLTDAVICDADGIRAD